MVVADGRGCLRQLRCLLLGNNRIDKWDSIDELGRNCTCLSELRLSGNPVLADSAKRLEVSLQYPSSQRSGDWKARLSLAISCLCGQGGVPVQIAS